MVVTTGNICCGGGAYGGFIQIAIGFLRMYHPFGGAAPGNIWFCKRLNIVTLWPSSDQFKTADGQVFCISSRYAAVHVMLWFRAADHGHYSFHAQTLPKLRRPRHAHSGRFGYYLLPDSTRTVYCFYCGRFTSISFPRCPGT